MMQEKSYDSEADISLVCLIYELCVVKPASYKTKTHSELSIFIRCVHFCISVLVYLSNSNGRIPPLTQGYSQAFTLNPFRTSTWVLPNFLLIIVTHFASSFPHAHTLLNSSNMNVLNHSTESETLRRCKSNQTTSELNVNPLFFLAFSVVKAHRAAVTAKEREIIAQKQTLFQNKRRLTSLLNQKDRVVTTL